MVRDICNCYFSFWTIFCPFTTLTAQKIKISIKKKITWRYRHFPQVYQKSWSYAILFLKYMVYDGWNCYFLFSAIFCPFDSPNSPKKSFRTMEKTTTTTTPNWRYHHFPQVYQKSWSYAILFLRYMVCDGCNCYFSFWAIFCLFTALTAQKIKILKLKKKIKKTKTKKITCRYHDHMLYCSWDIWCVTDVVVIFHFGCFFFVFFFLFTALKAQKIKIKKNNNNNKQTNKKTPEDIILHMCTKNYD